MSRNILIIIVIIALLFVGVVVVITATLPPTANAALSPQFQPASGMGGTSTLATAVPSVPVHITDGLTPTDRSGQGVIAQVSAASGSKSIDVATLGIFAITEETRIVDMSGQEADFSYLKRGQLVDVKGRSAEGLPIAEIVTVLEEDRPVPSAVVQ